MADILLCLLVSEPALQELSPFDDFKIKKGRFIFVLEEIIIIFLCDNSHVNGRVQFFYHVMIT